MADYQDRAKATWSAGDFDAIAQRIWAVGDDLVARIGVNEGERVLDVACGTGNAAIPAAAAGGAVTGLDITPELLDDARRNAAKAGVEVEWVEGDAQELPFDDGSFDVVLSTFGCMFAPDHRATALEIARVLAPGGRFGVVAWRPEGNIGKFFATIAQFAPPPPEGFQPPPLWGVRDHVTEIFAGTGFELAFEDSAAHFHFADTDEMVAEYSEKFGPIVLLRETLESEGRWEDLKAAMKVLYEDVTHEENGGVAFDGEYLITRGQRPDGSS
jgi:ubiquinone/menaquinone biosynthesis C-methylase UbiE